MFSIYFTSEAASTAAVAADVWNAFHITTLIGLANIHAVCVCVFVCRINQYVRENCSLAIGKSM